MMCFRDFSDYNTGEPLRGTYVRPERPRNHHRYCFTIRHGAVVASAAIEARNTETGAASRVAASATGNYTIAELPAGTYEVTVTVPGFKKLIRPGLMIQARANHSCRRRAGSRQRFRVRDRQRGSYRCSRPKAAS